MGVSKLRRGVASGNTFGTVNFLPGLGFLKKIAEERIILKASNRSEQHKSILKLTELPREKRKVKAQNKFLKMLKQHLLQQYKFVPITRNISYFKSSVQA